MRMNVFHEDEYLRSEFLKDLEDLPRQNLGMIKTRKIGLSRRLFRDRKQRDWSETFCKTSTRWI